MPRFLVLQSDFGLDDGAVCAMYGVAKSVDRDLEIYDLTHGITPFQILEGSYRLYQTVKFWPEGTVFVSVVDPGVGTDRKSVVIKTATGHFVVTPDNGTLTHIKQKIGIVAVREIDEMINRLKGSEDSHTFHGRDVYAYTGARLASGVIDFEGVGPQLNVEDIAEIPIDEVVVSEGYIEGTIEVLDIRFGHLWTNVSLEMFELAGFKLGDEIDVFISYKREKKFHSIVPYVRSFSSVKHSEPLIYMNSMLTVAVGLDQVNMAARYNLGTGPDWKITFRTNKTINSLPRSAAGEENER
ncbi:MAG: DNA-directed RNA polymerase subunit delta [Anaerolineales bacterium]|nr:MAG: DNA-directed RNA polymerase subunit delta [Anaerolineales bacterium]